ncbi:baseplate wedge subunit [Klebsiella phage CPRSA]|nr:baseplate wedge subunit [Klebsiella phage CPRSA]
MVYRVVDVPDIGSCSISSITGKLECIRIGGIWSPSHESSEPPRGEANGIDMGTAINGNTSTQSRQMS